MINELRVRVESILKSNLTNKELIKYSAISNILEDKYCFFKMSIEDAFKILKDLKYNTKESYEIYENMISFEKYEELIHNALSDCQ